MNLFENCLLELVNVNVNSGYWLEDKTGKLIHIVATLISFDRKNKACQCDATCFIRHLILGGNDLMCLWAKFIFVLWCIEGGEMEVDHLAPSTCLFQWSGRVCGPFSTSQDGTWWNRLECKINILSVSVGPQKKFIKYGSLIVIWLLQVAMAETSQWDYKITDSVDMCSLHLIWLKLPLSCKLLLTYCMKMNAGLCEAVWQPPGYHLFELNHYRAWSQ